MVRLRLFAAFAPVLEQTTAAPNKRSKLFRELFRSVVGLSTLMAISIAANAADLKTPVKAPPAPVPAPFSWTGFYIGGNLGGAWAHHNFNDSVFGLNFDDGNSNGVFIGGGQVGANYQFNKFRHRAPPWMALVS
jgi:opacity protein-like surface antigen